MIVRSSHQEVFLGKGVQKIWRKFTGETHTELWNHILAWVFSCKFASYFQNIFSSIDGCFRIVSILVPDIVIILTQLKWISQETKYHSQQYDKVTEKYGELFEEKECDSYQFANEDFLELALVREAFHKFIAEKVSYFNEALEILKVENFK